MNWLKELAPTVATALGGPLAGAAAAFLADKLGVPSKTVEAVSDALNSGKMTPEQITAIKVAEIEFKRFLKEHDIKLEQIHAQDRADARQMHVATRSPVPTILSIGVTLGYFGVLVGMMTDTLTVSESPALLIMLGSLGTAWGMVMSFWFGTTKGSADKNQMLAQIKGQ